MSAATEMDCPALSRGSGDAAARRTAMWLSVLVGAVFVLVGAGLRLETSVPAAGRLSPAALQDPAFVSPAQLANSRRLGAAKPRFWTVRTAAGVVADNSLQHLRSSFGSSGVNIAAPGATVGFSLAALGHDGRMTAVPASAPTAHANQVTYVHGGLREWYANGPVGLEQGLRVGARPSPRGGGPLTFSYRLSGSARPVLAGGRLTFLSARGVPVILYDGLTATDARGRTLAAQLKLRGSKLLIRVNDSSATYPITVDPLFRFAKLAESNRDPLVVGPAALALVTSTALSLSITALNPSGQPYTSADEGVGKTVLAKVTITNPPGGLPVTAVDPAAITVTPSSSLVATGSPTPAVPAGGYSIPANSSDSFTVPYKIVSPGNATLSDSATYINHLGQPSGPASGTLAVPLGSEAITVQSKAWIPFPYLVDPERLIRLPFDADLELADCYKPTSYLDETLTTVSSFYRGDTHVDYDGSYRVSSQVSFTWDGSSISNFTATGDYGTTHRDLVYNTTHGQVVCLGQEGTATSTTFGTAGTSSFNLGYNSSNPLIIPAAAAPGIDSSVTGYLSPTGGLALQYAEDLFPSHGIQVSINGTPVSTNTVGDATCLGQAHVLGVTGATILAWGLTHQDNLGTVMVNPAANPTVTSAPSPICSESFWGAVFKTVTLSSPAGASDSAASADRATAKAAPAGIEVAPVVGGKAGTPVPLATAVTNHLVSETPTNAGLLIASSVAAPVQITASGSQVVTTQEIVDGKPKPATLYKSTSGKLVLTAGGHETVTRNGHKLSGAKAPSKPPVTTATVTRKGKRATVSFHVTHPKLISTTIAVIARHKLKIKHGEVTIRVNQLAKLAFFSIDQFGNAERAHGLTRRQISGR